MNVELNPFSKLVRLLEQRYGRQKLALAETELQLSGAKDSESRWTEDQKKKGERK